MTRRTTAALAACAALVAGPLLAPADERLKGVACRSVHLGYPAPAASAFTTEMTVERSAEGSYFMAAGFRNGYFGIQEQSRGRKVVIFSVWDPAGGDDPKNIDAAKRVNVLHQGDGVRVGRFGGEGTGGQSFFDYDWKPGTPYRFLVTAAADGADRTAFAGYFYLPESKQWKHLVTFSTPDAAHTLTGLYSFVEDFRRNRVSATQPREAKFGRGWVKPAAGGAWAPLETARFTADANPVLNIDAGPAGDGLFFLATGGDVANTTTKLREVIRRPGPAGAPPADLPPGV